MESNKIDSRMYVRYRSTNCRSRIGSSDIDCYYEQPDGRFRMFTVYFNAVTTDVYVSGRFVDIQRRNKDKILMAKEVIGTLALADPKPAKIGIGEGLQRVDDITALCATLPQEDHRFDRIRELSRSLVGPIADKRTRATIQREAKKLLKEKDLAVPWTLVDCLGRMPEEVEEVDAK